jgi:DNA-binding NarL/FixJ family response regulator
MRVVRTADLAPEIGSAGCGFIAKGTAVANITKHATGDLPQWASDALRDLNVNYRRLGGVQTAMGLTDKEMQVALLIHQGGHSNKAIAVILGNSFRTIEAHRLRIHDALGVANSIQAAVKLERAIAAQERARIEQCTGQR